MNGYKGRYINSCKQLHKSFTAIIPLELFHSFSVHALMLYQLLVCGGHITLILVIVMVVIHYVTIDVLVGGQRETIVSNSINCLLLLKTKKISSLK